jgi:hypothetical protein
MGCCTRNSLSVSIERTSPSQMQRCKVNRMAIMFNVQLSKNDNGDHVGENMRAPRPPSWSTVGIQRCSVRLIIFITREQSNVSDGLSAKADVKQHSDASDSDSVGTLR